MLPPFFSLCCPSGWLIFFCLREVHPQRGLTSPNRTKLRVRKEFLASPARIQLQALRESQNSARSEPQLQRSLTAFHRSKSRPKRSLSHSYWTRTRRALLYLKRVPAPCCKLESHFPRRLGRWQRPLMRSPLPLRTPPPRMEMNWLPSQTRMGRVKMAWTPLVPRIRRSQAKNDPSRIWTQLQNPPPLRSVPPKRRPPTARGGVCLSS